MATQTQQVPSRVISCSFADSGPGLISDDFVQLSLGAGMSVSQAYSSLILTMGTTPNSEFLARTKASVSGAYTARWREMMSQRIVNNVMSVELADLIGSNLAYSVDATGLLITVQIPEHTFTSTSVGQFVSLGAITGAAVAMPGRYAITGVSGSSSTTKRPPQRWARIHPSLRRQSRRMTRGRCLMVRCLTDSQPVLLTRSRLGPPWRTQGPLG